MNYAARRERVRQELEQAGLDALLVTRLTNIRYLTGFSGSLAFLIISPRDVLVVDFVMPGLNAPDIIRRVARVSPRTRALVLSMHANPAYVVEAIQSGAAGYVLKGSSAAELVRAIRAVAEGSRHLSPPLSEEMVEAYAQRAVPTGLDLYRTLTQREREVLHLAAEGQTSGQIGARLNISPRTVEVHRANLLRKLRLRGQSDLVRYAVGRGILTVDG